MTDTAAQLEWVASLVDPVNQVMAKYDNGCYTKLHIIAYGERYRMRCDYLKTVVYEVDRTKRVRQVERKIFFSAKPLESPDSVCETIRYYFEHELVKEKKAALKDQIKKAKDKIKLDKMLLKQWKSLTDREILAMFGYGRE